MRRHRAILRAAALLVPGGQREEWLAEWRAELWHVSRVSAGGSHAATAFCLGAFSDALWLRWNGPRPDVRNLVRLDSAWRCVLFLAAMAGAAVWWADRLPEVREAVLASPYPDPRDLVMLARDGQSRTRAPGWSLEEYRSLAGRASPQFAGVAFYQPVPARVRTDQGQEPEFTIARSSGNLFELLGVRILPPGPGPAARPVPGTLILSDSAWRRHFAGDPYVADRMIQVAGRPTRIVGILAGDSWRLPGRVDGWLLDDERTLPSLPARSQGFVVARLAADRSHSTGRPPGRWSISVPNALGGYDRIECASLDRRQPFRVHVLMIILAIVIVGVAMYSTLPEYPTRHSYRRWIFVAVKIALLIPIVFFGILDLGALSSSQFQTHGFLFGYLLAFWWALRDQRRRCPQCLRLLAHPTLIGRPSNTFLEWYGTEFMCLNGHGLLHVPEIPSRGYRAEGWLSLDASWRSLFSGVAQTGGR